MGLLKLEKGQVLHRSKADEVHTLEVLVKGKLMISSDSSSIELDVGGIVGMVEKPGRKYIYSYEAIEDSTVYSYPFETLNDIPKIVRSNPRIAPVLAAQAISSASDLCSVYEQEFEQALREYEQIMADRADYPGLCIKAGQVPESFPEFDEIICPDRPHNLPEWVMDYCRSLKEHEALLKKSFYPVSLEIAVGMVMTAFTVYNTISDVVQLINEYKRILRRRTARFTKAMKMLRIRLKDMEKGPEGGEESTIVNALETIVSYASSAPEYALRFEELLRQFKSSSDRYGSGDEARALRKDLAEAFYDIYLPIFLRSLTDDDPPLEVKMFFMFGFVDEELAGEKNTAILANMAKSYTPDPKGRVLILYEWLRKIYMLEASPSRNEFDQDWPTYLRDLKNSGTIRDEQLDAMMNNPLKRLDFEIQNLFCLGNRMTFGRVSSFAPVFDGANVIRPLDTAYQTYPDIHSYFDRIRKIDYSVFARQAVYSDPEIGITQLYIDRDITPYMILMPNIGSRACLWQEMEGRNRQTPARMLVSVFNTENTEETMIRLFGEFRWEMCKAIQGVHWNDVTDPSLTSVYCDYLQFYKKNSTLSSDAKEKIRGDLKKYSNNYRNMFVGDYLTYIRYEAEGSLRLNKTAREMLFTFCPFSKEVRQKLSDNPQFTELISRHEARISNLSKPVANAAARLRREEIPVPKELTAQLEYLGK